MNKSYEYILFDWDGTLARTLDIWLDTYKELCVKYKADISNLTDIEIVEKSFGLWEKGLSNLGIKNAKSVYDEALKMVNEKVKTVNLYPDVKEVLEKLKSKGKRIALHTSSFDNLLYPALSYHNLDNYFEIILTRNDVKNGKPNPEVILKELDYFNADTDEALIVGDSDHDIKTGNNAGVDTVLFYPPENKSFYRKEFLVSKKPDYVISDLHSLIEVVN